MEYSIRLLRDLVAINSINPALVPGGAGEREIARATAAEMRQFGIDVYLQLAEKDRPNVIGIIEGRSPGKTLLLCGHLDTVGVEGMKDPFNPQQQDGRLYGRGSQDMKGGIAAMLAAAKSICENGGLAAGKVLLTAVVDEEYESIGASALVKEWKADAAIVLEPTDLLIAVAHKGFSWVEVQTKGRAAHGSRPQEGKDAILAMGQILNRIHHLGKRLLAQTPHPKVGTPSLHASLISGGRELSTYPDRCVLQMERRTVSGESENIAMQEINMVLNQFRAENSEFEAEARSLFSQPPYELPEGHELPSIIQAATSAVGRQTETTGMTYWTDAAILGKAGIPSVIFGPGGAGLHGIEEYVRVDEVIACEQILVKVIHEFCAGGKK